MVSISVRSADIFSRPAQRGVAAAAGAPAGRSAGPDEAVAEARPSAAAVAAGRPGSLEAGGAPPEAEAEVEVERLASPQA